MAAQPWVKQEQVNLSASHPKEDICDEWADAGPQPKGTYVLPAHPHCLCYKTAVMQDEDEFVGDLRDWLNGASNPGLDGYADFLGTTKEEIPN